AHGVITKALSKTFSPEFLNRVDDIIVFDQLSKESIKQIIDIELKGVYKRIKDLGYTLTLTDDAKSFIAEKGYDVQFGARPLKRAIQKYVEDEIAEVLLAGEINEDDEIVIELNDGKICCSVKKHITAAPLLEEEMALLDN
ncbi:MAG: ATP-dependent Clp protease ATP-binding subunit, partial [Paludibacteraceae bacterium]|nr:ATP-dependent Clp protease ATP-binding subunit [Paludibacteraceae bacterium]